MGLCSPPKVFSVQLLKAASWAAFFCPAGVSGARQALPSRPLGRQALLSLSSTSTGRPPISAFPAP